MFVYGWKNCEIGPVSWVMSGTAPEQWKEGANAFLKFILYIISLALSSTSNYCTPVKPVTGLVLKQAKAEVTVIWLQ